MSDSSPSQTQSQPAPATPAPAAVVAPEPAAASTVTPSPEPVSAAPVAAAPAVTPAPAPVAAAPAIPDKYVAPEGTKLDDSFLSAMSPAFKGAKLTQDQVNGLVKPFLEYQQALPARLLARDLEVTMKDPVLGGLNWGKTQSMVNDALAAFTTPEFRSKLERWGIANDLEFVRVFAAVGKQMRSDDPVRGQPTTAHAESRADRIYGGRAKTN